MNTILIIDDHKIIRGAISRLLTTHFPNVSVLQAETFSNALEIVSKNKKIDMIILDINIPGGKEHQMIKDFRNIQTGVPILIFSAYPEDLYAISFINAGANGFVSKNANEEDIILAIRMIISKGKYASLVVQDQIMNNFFTGKALPTTPTTYKDLLTAREYDILQLLLKGKWTKEIASTLKIKLSTVSTHKARIFEKLEVDNVIDLYKKIEKFSHSVK
jgi:two-component system invasion response regulator UvrY